MSKGYVCYLLVRQGKYTRKRNEFFSKKKYCLVWDLCWGPESVMRVVLMTGNISSVVSIVVSPDSTNSRIVKFLSMGILSLE